MYATTITKGRENPLERSLNSKTLSSPKKMGPFYIKARSKDIIQRTHEAYGVRTSLFKRSSVSHDGLKSALDCTLSITNPGNCANGISRKWGVSRIERCRSHGVVHVDNMAFSECGPQRIMLTASVDVITSSKAIGKIMTNQKKN